MDEKPLFITFEGIDGAGKSSHLNWFAEALRERGIKVTVTREPGGTPLGEAWRTQLLHEQLSPQTQTLLMFAARAVHLEQVIRPALARGEWVLCDRFTDATRAYQGGGYGVPYQVIDTLAWWLHGDCMPDKTLVFDVPLKVSRKRLSRDGRQANRKLDRFESEAEDFQTRVRQTYLTLAAAQPERYVVINSEPMLNVVRQSLTAVIDQLAPETA